MIKNRKSHAYLTLSFLFLLCFNIFTLENLLISNNLLFNNEQIKNLRTSGEVWFPSEHLSIGSCSYPEIAIDNYGNIHLIWRKGNNIFYKSKNVTSGNWTENVLLSSGISSISTSPDIAIDCFGNIHTTWQNYTSSNNNQAVFYKLKNITTGIWTPWEVLAIGSNTGSPAITTDHFGNLYLSFCYFDKIYMRRKPFNSNNWGSFESISSAAEFGSHNPSIVVDLSLNIYITWHDTFFSPSKGISQIYYAWWSSSLSSWSSPIKVSTGSFDGSWNPDIAIDASGTLHFVWSDQTDRFNENDDLSKDIFYRRRYSNGQWSSIKSLSDQLYFRSDYTGQKITKDNDSNIHVVWNCYYRKFDIINSVWKDTLSFASNGRDPALAIGFDNQLYLTWVEVIAYSADLLFRTCLIDDAKPIININSPTLNELFGTPAPSFNVEIGDKNLETMWYTLNNGLTNIIFADNGTIEQSAWEALPNGIVSIRFYANDSAGNIGFAEVIIRKDVNAPIITINNLHNSDVIGAVAPFFDIAIDELNLEKTWYSLNGGNNVTFTGFTGSINQSLWDALLEGNVIMRFYANDSTGYIGFTEVTVRKDVTAPTININSPTLNEIYATSAPSFNIEIYDKNLDTMWYSLDNGSTNTIFTTNGTINQGFWDALSNGATTITFYANDSAGNGALISVMVRVDKIVPIIVINIPILSELYGTSAPSYNVEIYDKNLDTMWYSLDNGSTNTIFTTNGTINQGFWDALSNGATTITFYANDSAGNGALISVMVRVDKIVPIIVINIPILSELYGTSAPSYNVEIYDKNLDTMWYTLDNGLTNTTFAENKTINQGLWSAILEGNATIKFYANDSAGNIGLAEVTIRKDVAVPIITINNPQNIDVFGAVAPNFDIFIEELNLEKTWYSLNGGNNVTFTGFTGSINQSLWNALPEGNIIIKFYANDTLGRIGFQEVTVAKVISQPSPPEISGYNILLLLGIFSVSILLIVKKKKNPKY